MVVSFNKEEYRRQESEDRMLTRRSPAKSFQDLIVWQKAHQFVLAVYQFTETIPQKEMYGLTAQLRRAAISIPANIAEGFKKKTKPDKARFMNISQGSLEDCRYYLILAKDLGYEDSGKLMTQLDEVGRILGKYSFAILVPDS